MKSMLFFIEAILLLSLLKTQYNISLRDIFHQHLFIKESQISHLIQEDEPIYSSYYAEDIIGDDILLLDNLSEKKKLDIWKNTSTKDEILNFFPNMEMMKMAFNNKIKNNGNFKIYFLDYMEEQHSKYITGEISSREFKKSILSPSFLLTDSL